MNGFPLAPCPVDLIHEDFTRVVESDEQFLRFAHRIAGQPYAAVLLSGGPVQAQEENRYSMVAWDPQLIFSSKGHSAKIISSRGTLSSNIHPLELLDELSAAFQPQFPLVAAPFSGGAVGYFSYDLKNVLERLPQTAVDDLQLPDVLLFWPRRLVIYDRFAQQSSRLELVYQGDDPKNAVRQAKTSGRTDVTRAPEKLPEGEARDRFVLGPLTSNFSHGEYLRAVRRVRQYIRAGDVYQVNLSQRYQFPFPGDPFQLWRSLHQINPAPFYALIQAGDHQVLSTSMERFLRREGQYLETRPIKGTRKRGGTDWEDQQLKQELLHSAKDDAELSMIVDLLRNDLGRVCLPRTIRVAEHKRLESYQNVHHLVSIVIGSLAERATYGDLIRATFPGGSITGCPKIRSMEIIDELEATVRHIYTGSIGYLGWHQNMDLNIAIRTALVHKGVCYFSVGGGIVYDSNEEDEYQETLHKGRTLFQVINRIGERSG